MPRANRYILPGYIYHLTHRCHDRMFLMKLSKDRNGYRRRLRQAVVKHNLSLLSYSITSNHVHLIGFSGDVEQIASVMQAAAGEGAAGSGLELALYSELSIEHFVHSLPAQIESTRWCG